jgi:hypothetical protein
MLACLGSNVGLGGPSSVLRQQALGDGAHTFQTGGGGAAGHKLANRHGVWGGMLFCHASYLRYKGNP